MTNNNSTKSQLEKRVTSKDIEAALKRFDWEAHWRRVEEAIAPEIEAYRIARARSYAQAKYHVFV